MKNVPRRVPAAPPERPAHSRRVAVSLAMLSTLAGMIATGALFTPGAHAHSASRIAAFSRNAAFVA